MIRRSVGKPTSRAVRALPPTTRSAKPDAVKLSHRPAARHSSTPITSPQCTSPSQLSGAMAPMRRPSPSGRVLGLFRLAGSRRGPSTKCLNKAIAM